nr:hypothetical protein [Tanacetum cinerariifolium]
MEEPTTESDSKEEQTPKIEKINRVKIERGETSNKKRSYEFRMPLHKGIPNKNSSSSQAINMLNLDCISDLNERKRILEKWSTEISLILQTNQEDFQMAKSVLTLIEHKTEGNIQSLVKQAQWNEYLHGIDFFDSIIDVLYTMFVGIDYHGNKDLEIIKEQDQARRSLKKIQLINICSLDEYTCLYEKYLYKVPLGEHLQWIKAYLMKIPIISEQTIQRWKNEGNTISKNSLAFATRLAKEEIAKICNDRYKQKKLKSLSKRCCKNIIDMENLEIGNLKFKGFKEYRLHCYIDTGASLCLASKYVFPHDLWENAPKEITGTIANGDTIKINQVCRNISLRLSGYEFNIPTIYQQNFGIDLILGNNFCQLYGPFIQWIDRIAFHLNDELIIIKKEPVLKPDYLKAAKKEETRYYVIYKGHHNGIYTNWGEVKDICEEDKVICKKIASIEQAKLDLEIYSDGPYKNPLLLRPKVKAEKKKEEHRDQRFKKSVQEESPEPIVIIEEFRQLWNKARASCQEDFLHEKIFTTDKLTKSLFNFIEGADPILIYQSFRAGLINNIYPSNNLLELKMFPSPMMLAIKNFRKKVLKAKDSPIYIKVISSIPDWNHEENYSPYYFIEISLASSKKEFQPFTVKKDDPDRSLLDTLAKIRVQNLRRIVEQILHAISDGERKINYAVRHCIITSRSLAGSSEEDSLALQQYGLPFLKNTIEASGTTKGAF